MKRHSGMLRGAGQVLLLAALCLPAGADVKKNPYESIVARNPFGLKPIPPPEETKPATPAPPPPPTATVELTGIVSILGKNKRALLEVIPGPGKPMAKPILSEGEKFESVEVLAINIDKNEVKVKNGTLVTNLTFKVVKSTPAPAGPLPGNPALPNPLTPPVHHSAALQPPAYNNSGRNTPMVGGGAPTVPPPNTFGNPAAPAAAAAIPTGADSNFRSIPSRNIRTTAPQANAPVSLEEHYIMTEMNRNVHGIPLPPTPLNPNPVYPNRAVNTPGGTLPPGVNFPPLPGGGNPQQ